MNEAIFSPLLERALRLAAVAHREQDRKGSGAPYVTHLAGVALILARAGFCDEQILAAALLHDVIEDTDVPLDQLAGQFPAQILELVAALTERKTDERGAKRPWEDRKAGHLKLVAHAPLAARAIVLADKLHNLESMLFDLQNGTLQWAQFHAPPDRVAWCYGQMVDCAAGNDPELRPLANACREALERLRRTIGR